MKFYAQILSTLLALVFAFNLQAVPMAISTPNATPTAAEDLTISQAATLSKKEIEAQIGRKLDLGERMALHVLKRKAKKAAKKAAKANGTDYEGEGETDGFAIASMVLGILSFVGLFFGGILAIIFGVVAKRRIEADPSLKGEGMAKAGLILGIISVSLTVLIFIVALALGVFFL